MKYQRWNAANAAAIGMVLVVASGASAAHADERVAADDVAAALSDVTANTNEVSASVLNDVAPLPPDTGEASAISAVVGGVSVEVPNDPSEALSLTSSSGNEFAVTLPFSDEAGTAETLAPGIVVYDNQNGSATTPVVKTDGSIQVTTLITSADAPGRYDYDITIPDGGSATIGDDGSLTVLAADGSFFAGAGAAWALDANQRPVPTHYELHDSTLTQVVDLKDPTIAYPVVADPWFGIDLINRTFWTNSNKTLSVDPTWWGRYGAGVAARWAGWAEVQTKTPGTRENTSSMQDQFFCHFDVVRLRAPNKPTWNLDLGRTNVSYPQMIAKQCNP